MSDGGSGGGDGEADGGGGGEGGGEGGGGEGESRLALSGRGGGGGAAGGIGGSWGGSGGDGGKDGAAGLLTNGPEGGGVDRAGCRSEGGDGERTFSGISTPPTTDRTRTHTPTMRARVIHRLRHQGGLALSPSVFAPPLSKDGSGLTAGNSRLNSWERPEGPACSTIPGRPEGPAADVTSNEAPAAPGAAADPAGGTYGARSEEVCVRGRTAGSGGGVSGSAEPAPAPSLRPQRSALDARRRGFGSIALRRFRVYPARPRMSGKQPKFQHVFLFFLLGGSTVFCTSFVRYATAVVTLLTARAAGA